MSVLVVGGIFREIRDADTRRRVAMGGSGLTAAIVAARLGAETMLASYVGAEDAEVVFANLETADVEHGGVVVLPGSSGTFLFPTHETPGQPWPMYRPAEAVPSVPISCPSTEIVLAFGIPDFDTVSDGLTNTRGGATLVWDRQGFISRNRDCRAASVLHFDNKIYLANLAEASDEFAGTSEAETLAQLPPAGFRAAIIKRGPAGCTVVDSARSDVPGFPISTTSTIGSGDAFAGGLVAGLDRNLELIEAARLGNAAAAAYLERGTALEDGFGERVEVLFGRS